ncbi:MAG: type II toxin-antitoxin system prevent-host-death family antitoxin [Hydrogenophilaceae bacterium]|nr:type II toxin-antitoxin system prevent-host-death family antitoxin [Hydrogenophilaceae bacterium]
MQMNVAEAKAKLSELIARAEAGEEVIIARDGKPAVVLKPAGQTRLQGAREIGIFSHLGEVWVAPDAWSPDEEAADFLDRSFAEDQAGPLKAGEDGP